MRRRIVFCSLTAAVTLLVFGTIFHLGLPVVLPGIPPQFSNSGLYRPWAGWTSTYMLIHPLWFGVVFGGLYSILRSRDALAPGWRDGLAYGFGVFFVGSLPVFLLAFAAVQISPEVMAVWVAQSLCQYAAAGVAIGTTTGRN